jgi:hypothetical protein
MRPGALAEVPGEAGVVVAAFGALRLAMPAQAPIHLRRGRRR